MATLGNTRRSCTILALLLEEMTYQNICSVPDRDLAASVLVHFNYLAFSLDAIWRGNKMQAMKQTYPEGEVFFQLQEDNHKKTTSSPQETSRQADVTHLLRLTSSLVN